MPANPGRCGAVVVLVLAAACRRDAPPPAPAPTAAPRATPAAARDPFEEWLAADFPVADGFGAARLGTEARAVANGRVASAEQGRVVVDHVFYENHERRAIRSVSSPVSVPRVRAGDVVARGDALGAADDRFRLELRWDVTTPPAAPPLPNGDERWTRARVTDAAAFVASHRSLPVPQSEPALVLVSTAARRMRLRAGGAHVGDFEVGFGQGEGRKRVQGDERTPLGMYFVVAKSRGPFEGPTAAYFGGHWIKVNYPNGYDAEWGRRQGLLTADAARDVTTAWRQRGATPQRTALGGGIGFHGWADDWEQDGPRRLSWGCVVMRNDDIRRVFDRMPVGAMVVIF